MGEGLLQAVEVVVVALLQVLPDRVQHRTLAVSPAEVRVRGSPVEKIAGAVLVGSQHDPVRVVFADVASRFVTARAREKGIISDCLSLRLFA